MWCKKLCSGQQSNLTHIHYLTLYFPNKWRRWMYTTILSINTQFVCLRNAVIWCTTDYMEIHIAKMQIAQEMISKDVFVGLVALICKVRILNIDYLKNNSYKKNKKISLMYSQKSNYIDTHVDIATMFVFWGRFTNK